VEIIYSEDGGWGKVLTNHGKSTFGRDRVESSMMGWRIIYL